MFHATRRNPGHRHDSQSDAKKMSQVQPWRIMSIGDCATGRIGSDQRRSVSDDGLVLANSLNHRPAVHSLGHLQHCSTDVVQVQTSPNFVHEIAAASCEVANAMKAAPQIAFALN